MAKLEAEHAARIRRERQQPPGLPSNPPSLSSSATTSNVHRIAPSHRGMTYDVIESNPPRDEDHLMPLPSRWSDLDKYPGLDITNSGLDVKYSGAASKADIEAASVRADYPMSPACGIHYFEVTVKSKNKDCAIAVGFSTAQASLERLPGWETHSWGYHGDDGKMFSGEHAGRHYGPNFSAEDVVGCGINFNTGQAFFTLNGKDLDVCFRDLKEVKPFPTVGMKKYSGASVSVNFGQKPFLFDIEEKMLEEEAAVDQEIAAAKTSSLRPGLDENSLIQELVAQYLAHDGYVETAKAFQEETTREKNALNSAQPGTTVDTPHVDNAEAMHRQREFAPLLREYANLATEIRSAILEGDIDRALDVTEDHFPNVLKVSPQIVFRMKCRKWVELISKANDLRAREDTAHKSRRISNGYSKTSAVADEFAQDMELDEQPRGDANGTKGTTIDSARNPQYDRLLAEAMEYGQVLQRDYRDSPDAEQGKALLDIFSLVAYDNPRESVHGSLLDRKGRVAVAEELNSAILGKSHWLFCCWLPANMSSLAWSVASCSAGEDVEADRSVGGRIKQGRWSCCVCEYTSKVLCSNE